MREDKYEDHRYNRKSKELVSLVNQPSKNNLIDK